MTLKECLDEFLNGKINADKVEEIINNNPEIMNLDSINFGKSTRELNKKYREVTGEGITINVGVHTTPRSKMIVELCRIIENKNI